MTTPLVLYPVMRQPTSTLATASKCVKVDGSFPVNTPTTYDRYTHFGQVWPRGQGASNTWAASTTIGNPDGHGWLYDSPELEGMQLNSGRWDITLSLNSDTGPTANMHFRAFKRSAANDYSLIDEWIANNVTLTAFAGITVVNLSGAIPATHFLTGEKLYFDYWPDITVNDGSFPGASMYLYGSTDANQGTADLIVSTAGYIPYVAPLIEAMDVAAIGRSGRTSGLARSGVTTGLARDGKIITSSRG
mgnify:CR=1 FL=1